MIRRSGLGLDGETEEPWATLDTHVDGVVLADRLREVRALTGFRRHSPGGTLVPADTSGRLRWLPATEVYGEGIVLTLDEQRLNAWESDPRVQAHVHGVRTDLDGSFRADQLAETAGSELSPASSSCTPSPTCSSASSPSTPATPPPACASACTAAPSTGSADC